MIARVVGVVELAEGVIQLMVAWEQVPRLLGLVWLRGDC